MGKSLCCHITPPKPGVNIYYKISDPWRDDPEVGTDEELSISEVEDEESDDAWEDVGQKEVLCICGECKENPDIPAKCCLSQPCLGKQDSGKEPYVVFFVRCLYFWFVCLL